MVTFNSLKKTYKANIRFEGIDFDSEMYDYGTHTFFLISVLSVLPCCLLFFKKLLKLFTLFSLWKLYSWGMKDLAFDH